MHVRLSRRRDELPEKKDENIEVEDLHKVHNAQLLIKPYSTIQGDRVAVKFRGKPPKRWEKTAGSSRHSYNEGTLKKNVTAVILAKYTNVSC